MFVFLYKHKKFRFSIHTHIHICTNDKLVKKGYDLQLNWSYATFMVTVLNIKDRGTYTIKRIHMCEYIYIYIYTHTHTYICIHICKYIYTHMISHMYMFIYIMGILSVYWVIMKKSIYCKQKIFFYIIFLLKNEDFQKVFKRKRSNDKIYLFLFLLPFLFLHIYIYIYNGSQSSMANFWNNLIISSYTYTWSFYHIYQPLRSGRMWHKVNF